MNLQSLGPRVLVKTTNKGFGIQFLRSGYDSEIDLQRVVYNFETIRVSPITLKFIFP